MLVKLTSNKSGEIIMFAEHLHQLFEIIGKEGTARGVFTTEQLPQAIEKLHFAVNTEKHVLHAAERVAHEAGIDDEEDDEEGEAAKEDRKAGRIGVHLAQRAHPLIQMMEWTYKEGGFILWEAEEDF